MLPYFVHVLCWHASLTVLAIEERQFFNLIRFDCGGTSM